MMIALPPQENGIITEDFNAFNDIRDRDLKNFNHDSVHEHDSEEEDKLVITALHPFLHKPFLNWLRHQDNGHKLKDDNFKITEESLDCSSRTGVKDCGPCSICTCNSGTIGLHKVCTCETTAFDNLVNYFKDEY